MQRRVLLCLGLLLCLPAMAHATVTITAPTATYTFGVDTGLKNLLILITSDASETVNSGDVFTTMGGGTAGPPITAISFTAATSPTLVFTQNTFGNSIFAYPVPNGLKGVSTNTGLLASRGVITKPDDSDPDNPVPVNVPIGVAAHALAQITIDLTGVPVGDYILALSNGLGPSAVGPDPFVSYPTTLNSGIIHIIPEPASLMLALCGAAGVAAVFVRRNRARKAA